MRIFYLETIFAGEIIVVKLEGFLEDECLYYKNGEWTRRRYITNDAELIGHWGFKKIDRIPSHIPQPPAALGWKPKNIQRMIALF